MKLAGTGHRPNEITIAGLNAYDCAVMERLTGFAIDQLKRLHHKHNLTAIISGMALGWDTALAIGALELGIPLVAAVPFAKQSCRWGHMDRIRYHDLLSSAHEVVYVDALEHYGYARVSVGDYHGVKMYKRNEWMVDQVAEDGGILLALYNGSEGGTQHCVEYAKRLQRDRFLMIENVWNKWEKTKELTQV